MERLVGRKAPDFIMEAVAADGESFTHRALSDYQGKWLVLFFYPMDFTFVCPTELTAFSGWLDRFHAAGAELLAVSTDSKYDHLAWIRNGLGKIGYPMAADKTLTVSAAYGVLLEDEGVALRGLFIIDPEQNVRYSALHDNNVGRSVDETYRVLKALQTGGLCGANWSTEDDTLHPESVPETGSEAAPHSEHAAVKIYTMPECSYCKSVKTFLTDRGVIYSEVNLATDKAGQAFMNERGYRNLPVTVINGKEIAGYDMPKIKEALGV